MPEPQDRESSPDLIYQAQEREAAEYAGNLALRVVIAALPHIGGPLDAYLSGRAQQVYEARIQKFLEDLHIRLAMLEEGKLDEEFTWSNKGWDWFRSTLEQVIRTEDETKLRAFREVYVRGLTRHQSRRALKDIILGLLGRMSAAHIAVLQTISEVEELPPEPGAAASGFVSALAVHARLSDLGGVELAAVISDLEAEGLLINPPSVVPATLGWSVAHSARGQNVKLSEFGRTFVDFLSERTSTDPSR